MVTATRKGKSNDGSLEKVAEQVVVQHIGEINGKLEELEQLLQRTEATAVTKEQVQAWVKEAVESLNPASALGSGTQDSQAMTAGASTPAFA